MIKNSIEKYFLNVVRGKKKGFLSFCLKTALWFLSFPFRFIVFCRNWVFDKGWVSCYFPPVPVVISIGNIVLGGTGKTPVTLMIAQEFYTEFLIAVLSRGYRSQAEKLPIPIVLCKGNGPMQSAAFCGDEPFLIAQHFPKAYVIVGKNRHKAADIAAKASVQLILLDDGMQHRRLARDIEVVVMDSHDLFGQGYYFPRGFLREGAKSLSRAHLVILNHIENTSNFNEMKKIISCYTKALIVGTKMAVEEIQGQKEGIIQSIKGIKVGLFCGIAHPEYFQKTITDEGAEIIESAIIDDHRSFTLEFLKEFALKCKNLGAEILVCTEKDLVKILDVKDLALPIVCVKMHLKLTEGESDWRIFMDKIKSDLRKSI